VEPVSFLDRGGAQLFGRVWAPKGATGRLPSVVVINGSVQAPETLYWWAAQAMVDAGYVVMTFDPRGQGRSDNRTPDGEQGSNANPDVFATNLVDAIDFFRSTRTRPTRATPRAGRGR
jgi:alpha-beta hydrolase superfamily lysophospholipase